MAKENLTQLRQLIAQKAAQMMAEDGISDFSYAKNKAGRQIGALDNRYCLQTQKLKKSSNATMHFF